MTEDFINSGPFRGTRKLNRNKTWAFIDIHIPSEVKEELQNHEFTVADLGVLVDAAIGIGAAVKISERKGGRSYTATISRPKQDGDSYGASVTAFAVSVDSALSALSWKFLVALGGDLGAELSDDDDTMG